MTDHLPECGYSPGQPGFGGINSGIPSTQPYLAPSPCICDELRACEQRVRQEIDRKAFVWDEGDPYREAYRAGYSKGVRDAHESASWCQDPDEMLQAIIGLLNMPPPPPLPPSVGVPEKWRP